MYKKLSKNALHKQSINIEVTQEDTQSICMPQVIYSNRGFGNVYLLALDNTKR